MGTGSAVSGEAYRDGRGVPRDDQEAIRWFRLAAQQDDASAMNALGAMYATGRGVASDDTEAAKWYRRAAERGDPVGQRALALAYRTGKGVPRDEAEALRWLRLAADQGDVPALRWLGIMSSDDVEAFGWYRRAAEQGDGPAMWALGFVYRRGQGVGRDDVQAVYWFHRAAEDLGPWAQVRLGEAYRAGVDVPRDDEQARYWFDRAAEKGDAAGQLELARLYHLGGGIEQDPVQAYVWYTLAAAQMSGDKRNEVQEEIRTLEPLLTPDLVARAQEMIRVRAPKPDLAASSGRPSARPVSASAKSEGSAENLIPRRLLAMSVFSEPRLSPDGQRLAYLSRSNGSRDISVAALGAPGTVLVAGESWHLMPVAWECDSQHLLYLRRRDGAESWELHRVDAETRAVHGPLFTGVERLHVSCHDPDRAVVFVFRGEGLTDVYRLTMQTGERALIAGNPGDIVEWLADSRLRLRAAVRRSSSGDAVVLVRDHEGAPWREVHRGPADAVGRLVSMDAESGQLYLLSSVGAPAARLLRVDTASDRSVVVAEDPQFDLAHVLTHPRNKAAQAVAFERDRTDWTALDPSLATDFRHLRAQHPGDFKVLWRDLDDHTWVVAFEQDVEPPSYFRYDRRTRELTLLFSGAPGLAGFRLAPMRPISFQARDGLRLHGYLTLPPDPASGSLPMVLLVHGGPWRRDAWGFDHWVQWLANRGYAVLQVNFRGSTGYGKAHLLAGAREWAGKMLTDLLDGKAWAVSQGYVDASRGVRHGRELRGVRCADRSGLHPDRVRLWHSLCRAVRPRTSDPLALRVGTTFLGCPGGPA